jgi:GntR family transcriptional regulator/MocR family aminotransferase
MHVLSWLPAGSDDQALAHLAAQHDVTVSPLSRHCMEPSAQRAVLLGYAAVPIPAIQAGMHRLVTAFSRG